MRPKQRLVWLKASPSALKEIDDQWPLGSVQSCALERDRTSYTRARVNAYVKHHFEKGFCLKEEDLTKLLDFVRGRANEVDAANEIRIKVYRADSLVYECPTLEPLRSEENAVRNRLVRVQVLLKHKELNVDFDLDGEEGASIEIEATDRDRAYLLFSELKEYLNTTCWC